MACGTGKTFTSLKIMERETGGRGLVLFLAPSIALVGQTLREWKAGAEFPFLAVCVCSDSDVGRQRSDDGGSVEDLAFPATTDARVVAERLTRAPADGLAVIFSTYQSIAAVSAALKAAGRECDLVVCDEAHRTTGVTLKDEDESAFVRVHDNAFLPAKRRLYMTATPRLYAEDSRKRAKEADAVLCSMDDEDLYGPEVFRMGFGEAVDAGLLADYKVFVITVGERDLPDSLAAAVADGTTEIDADDASRLVGCICALSKRMLADEALVRGSDPEPMRRAVAFCQNINASKRTAGVFADYGGEYRLSLPEEERDGVVVTAADHVDGSMPSTRRDAKLAWLKAAGPGECRVLCNVRCLSEGVDVPSLDAVLFLSPRSSQIDVVQSVGRVMRTAPGKKFGYIVIPVVVPFSVPPEEALNDNKKYAVIWSVLNALRAHDDRFDAVVNRIDLNGRGDRIVVGTPGQEGGGGKGSRKPGDGTGRITLPIARAEEIRNALICLLLGILAIIGSFMDPVPPREPTPPVPAPAPAPQAMPEQPAPAPQPAATPEPPAAEEPVVQKPFDQETPEERNRRLYRARREIRERLRDKTPMDWPENNLTRWAISMDEGNLKIAMSLVEQFSGKDVPAARKRKAATAIKDCMDKVVENRPSSGERKTVVPEDVAPCLLECARQAKGQHPWLTVE